MVAARPRNRPTSHATPTAAIVASHEPTRHHHRSAARRLRRLPARQLPGPPVDLAHAGGHRPGRDLPGAAAPAAAGPLRLRRQAAHRPICCQSHRPRPHRRRAAAARRRRARPELRRHLVQRAAQAPHPGCGRGPVAGRHPRRRRQGAALERRVVGPARVHAGRRWRRGAHRSSVAEDHAAVADARPARRPLQGVGEGTGAPAPQGAGPRRTRARRDKG